MVSGSIISVLHGLLYGLMSFAYCLTFSVFLMFMSGEFLRFHYYTVKIYHVTTLLALFVMKVDSQTILSSSGPRSVALSLSVLLIPCCIALCFTYAKVILPFDIALIYFGNFFKTRVLAFDFKHFVYFPIGAMVTSTCLLILKFKRVAQEWSSWPDSLVVT
jgi:hypothetical protein